MLVKNFPYVCFILFATMPSCKAPSFKTEQEAYKYLNSENNGTLRFKNVNGYRLSAKFVPNEMLVWKEVKDGKYNDSQIDSLLEKYSKSLTFLLTISSIDSSKKDVMYDGIENYEQYKRRVQELNFEADKDFTLMNGGGQYKPVLCAFENTYNLATSRSFYLVFVPDKKGDWAMNENLDIKISDHIFGTGETLLSFKGKDLENIPKIAFW